MHPRSSCAVLALLCAIALPSFAQVYKWVDEKGVTHYGERPPAQSVPRTARKLDIPLTGNDRAEASAEGCYTIRCQYERLRQDRLQREAEWRRETEARVRMAEARQAAEAATRPSDPGGHEPVYPIYRRARVFPVPVARPATGAAPSREPTVNIRMTPQ